MTQLLAALDGAWRVLISGVLLGAGLPAMFAFGVRALAWGTGGEATEHGPGESPRAHLAGRIVAYTMFTLVVLAVLLGISYIVAHGLGMTMTFDGLIPRFSRKG